MNYNFPKNLQKTIKNELVGEQFSVHYLIAAVSLENSTLGISLAKRKYFVNFISISFGQNHVIECDLVKNCRLSDILN